MCMNWKENAIACDFLSCKGLIFKFLLNWSTPASFDALFNYFYLCIITYKGYSRVLGNTRLISGGHQLHSNALFPFPDPAGDRRQGLVLVCRQVGDARAPGDPDSRVPGHSGQVPQPAEEDHELLPAHRRPEQEQSGRFIILITLVFTGCNGRFIIICPVIQES